MRSARRLQYPTSLSYQPITFTRFPTTEVNSASKTQEWGFPTMSEETMGSSVYCKIPFREVAEAFLKASFISFGDGFFFNTQEISVREPSGTGTRMPQPP